MVETIETFGLTYKHVYLICDNKSNIDLSNNPLPRSRMKHIDVRDNFICEYDKKEDVCTESIHTNFQLANMFTKPSPRENFNVYIKNLGSLFFMVCSFQHINVT